MLLIPTWALELGLWSCEQVAAVLSLSDVLAFSLLLLYVLVHITNGNFQKELIGIHFLSAIHNQWKKVLPRPT